MRDPSQPDRQAETPSEAALAALRLGLGPGRPRPHAGVRVHFVGVGGAGMSNLAACLHVLGASVSGSDQAAGAGVEALRALGVPVHVGHEAANVPPGVAVAVVTAAVGPDNPEVVAARAASAPVVKYAQVLGMLMAGRRGVAVAGTHGKTTVTGMIATVLRHAGMDPTFIIGGVVRQLLGAKGRAGCVGQGDVLVVEACEYDRSFLNFRPHLAVITNIEPDHMDYFRDEADLVDAFGAFAERAVPEGAVVANADDTRVAQALRRAAARPTTFGLGPAAEWRTDPSGWRRAAGRTRFRVSRHGIELGELRVRPPGRHTVLNALAAAAAAVELGVPFDAVRDALETYCGAERRMEDLGSAMGVRVVDDYGHHPTEVATTLAALREEYGERRLWCVFQPHQHSRTRLLMEGFVRAFGQADRVLLPEIYAVRDSPEDRRSVSSADLARNLRAQGVDAEYLAAFDEVVDRLVEEVEAGDLVVTMGAGPVNRVAHSLLRRLREEELRVGATEAA